MPVSSWQIESSLLEISARSLFVVSEFVDCTDETGADDMEKDRRSSWSLLILDWRDSNDFSWD